MWANHLVKRVLECGRANRAIRTIDVSHYTMRKLNERFFSVRSRSENEPQQVDTAVAIFEKMGRMEALITMLSKDIGPELRQNIILNPDPHSKLRHIEITADMIRLEYSEITEHYSVSDAWPQSVLIAAETRRAAARASQRGPLEADRSPQLDVVRRYVRCCAARC